MSEPQYISEEYRQLFKELKPEDLQFPEWLQRHLQSQYCYSQWSPHLRKALCDCLKVGVVPMTDDFKVELMLRKEKHDNARTDLINVLKKIAEHKAKPFDDFVSTTFHIGNIG